MKKLVLLTALSLCLSVLNAQNIAGIVNAYAAVNAVNLNVLTVSTTVGFNINDKVMIIKMKGASINTTNTALYGDTVNTNQAGVYVFSKVIAKTNNTLTLSPFCNSFINTNYLQIVKIPVYSNPTVVGTITCPPYDGITGGIIAIEADTLSLLANIDASALGYRGGDIWGAGNTCGSVNFFSPQSAFGPAGKKGEGIADWIVGQECGKGKLANGGGGSFSNNTGAGGGGNYGKGGHGGWEYSHCLTTNIFSYGAQSLAHDNNHFFMGGGGGGPQNDNGNQVYNGGNGGGIIYIKANQINSNNNSILSRGENTPLISNEGASGGGAGGCIIINNNSFVGLLNLNVSGGNGGSNFDLAPSDSCHGPGGGGGGGIIHLSTATTPINVFTSFAGGSAGLVTNPASPCYNTSYNAQNGDPGGVMHNFVATPLPAEFPFSLGPDIILCNGLSATLDAGLGFSSYLWDNQSNGQTRSITTPGTYFATITNNLGCTSSDTLIVNSDTSIHAQFSIIKRLGCENDTIELVNTSTGATNYIWFFGDSQSSLSPNPTHVYTNQATYNVTLVAFNPPCSDTISTNVNVAHPLIANMNLYGNLIPIRTDTTCVYDNMNAQSISVPVGLTQHEFFWGDGTSSNVSFNTVASHKYSAGGIYDVTMVAMDTLGCTDTVTHPVYVDGSAYGEFIASDSVVCVGTPIVFNDSLGPFTTSFTYDFGDQSVVDDVRNPVHSFDRGNNYIITLTVRNLICPDTSVSRSIVVDDFPIVDLGKDTSICPGITGTIILSNLDNPAGVYEWSTGEVANNLTVVNPGHYWVKAQSPNAGCESVDSIFIARDCYLNIPNAFSPDGDGLNDYFIPRELNASGVKSFKMNIYNRWGQNVFTSEQIDGRGWDGQFNDKNQPLGVYIYTIDVEFNNKIKKSFKGNVTLVR